MMVIIIVIRRVGTILKILGKTTNETVGPDRVERVQYADKIRQDT